MATRQATMQTKRQVLNARSEQATKRLRDVFGLPDDVYDAKLLGTALAEVGAEEGRHNAQFVRAVRQHYDDLVRLSTPTTKRTPPKSQEPTEPLVPIRRFEGHRNIDPFAPVDPRFLSQLYGHDKLAQALRGYTQDRLKRTAAVLEREHPGTKPTNRGKIESLIAYIVEHTPDDGLVEIPGSRLLI